MNEHRRHFWHKLRTRWQAWNARFGHLLLTVACVAVIIGTAIGTERKRRMVEPPPADAHSAAQLMQQSLNDAHTSTPSSTPPSWQAPLDDVVVLRPYSSELQRISDRLWALHDAVDLAAAVDAPVRALSSGDVLSIGENDALGPFITMLHHGELTVCYAGIRPAKGLSAGSSVSAGQIIGSIEQCSADEAALGPHLHLRASRSGQSIDPLTLFCSRMP